MENFVNLVERNRLPDMGKSWNPIIPYKFPKLLTPETLKRTVWESDEIERICKFYSDGNERKAQELRTVVKAILEEIGFKRNMSIIRFLGSTLNKILLQTTAGVYVNQYSITAVKRELSKSRCPVLYLPSHRSYADFVLMSWICFDNDVEIPAIAAGMDFHAMVGMGSMLRNTGAFFMRRSFSSDQMYWEVFREYVRTLITKYHSGVEFFLEGTRSRSAKSLPPKIGLLSMLLEPFLKRKIFDISVVPVAVSYDRPVEEKLFAYELLGVPKPKESTSGLFKAFNIMDTNHGEIFINFGETMSLFDYFERNRSVYWSPNEPNAPLLTKDRLHAIGLLARDVVAKQQRLSILTAFNMICIYFQYRSMVNEFCNRDELNYGIHLLSNFLKKIGALLSCEMPSTNVSNIIEASLEIHSNILRFSRVDANLQLVPESGIGNTTNVDPNKLKGHSLSAITLKRCLPSFVLQIYANPCLFWLHQPAFYLLARKMNVSENELSVEIQRMKKIFVNEFITQNDDASLEESIDLWTRLDIAGNTELSNIILSSIVPFVFCYFNVVDVVKSQLSQCSQFTEQEFYVKVQMHCETKLNTNATFIHPYCLSLDSIANALHMFVANKCLIKNPALSDNKTVINYHANDNEMLSSIWSHLHVYCSMLQPQFNGLANYLIFSKI